MFTPLIRLPNQLKDVPSGIEGVTLTDVVTPEYAKSTIPCKKFTWILDATPRIELDFGPDTKKFQFHIESSQFDLFKIDKDVSFERTATHSIFRVRKIDRNPPSRIKLLEEYTMKYWTLLRTEKCEHPTRRHLHTKPTQIPARNITSDYLRLPEIKFTAPIKKSEKKLKPIKHETMDIYAKFLPFIYFINMECKKVKARSENIKAWDLNTFLKAWIGGKKLQNLQSFTFYYSDMVKPLAYEDVLNNIHSETGKARNFEKVPE
ncbi:Protein CBG07509 [Caenorhabditis briggsae]|uniref:Protein CBG07509 n=1 Tax=Caenorhabditis briggsae TaxID=6238 RepID=A8X4N0_CAEBR|nr:Protein CBG07509 [Caenorhabditis briggsae]CAP27590.2 Protein CBG07509 [Caenorhabditis briggsae]